VDHTAVAKPYWVEPQTAGHVRPVLVIEKERYVVWARPTSELAIIEYLDVLFIEIWKPFA
jgi:hypothetical protein